jgi:hypothetical protein
MRGRVLAADGTPLRRAQITVISPQRTDLYRGATTDGDGKWEVTDLPGGRYTVSASKGGFATVMYGQHRPFQTGTQVVVAEAATVEHLDVTLQRGAVIAGRIVDDHGEPVTRVGVQAMRYTYSNDGQRRLTSVNSAATDDLGQFRIFGLMPGDYVVQASGALGPGAPGPESFAATYYPGTPNADEAQTVTLALGEETNIQFQLVAATRTSRVTGVVVNSDGAPLAGTSLTLVTSMGGTGWMMSLAGSTAADGTFTLTNVSPGEHTIRAGASRALEGVESGSYNFTANGEPITVRIVTSTSSGAVLRGRVVWEGNTPRRTMPSIHLQQSVSEGFAGSVPDPFFKLSDDNRFDLFGVTRKGFIRPVYLPACWTGTVADAQGKLLNDYVVVLLPSGLKEGLSPQRFISVVRPDQDGSFRVKGMPPGSYVATALEWVEQGRQFVPGFQEQLRKAGNTLTLREGQATTIDLKLVEGL